MLPLPYAFILPLLGKLLIHNLFNFVRNIANKRKYFYYNNSCNDLCTLLTRFWQHIVGYLPVLQQKSSSTAGSGHAARRRRAREGERRKGTSARLKVELTLLLQPKCEYCKSASEKQTKIEKISPNIYPSREPAKSMRWTGKNGHATLCTHVLHSDFVALVDTAVPLSFKMQSMSGYLAATCKLQRSLSSRFWLSLVTEYVIRFDIRFKVAIRGLVLRCRPLHRLLSGRLHRPDRIPFRPSVFFPTVLSL